MDSYNLKFENGRSCTIECDNKKSFQDKINECEVRYDSECIAINGKPIKKHSLGGFLVGATIGAIFGNSVPAHTVSKTTKGVKRTTKTVARSVKKHVKKFSGGGIAYKDAIAEFNDELREHPIVIELAKRYNKTPIEVVKHLQPRLSTKGNRAGKTVEVSIDLTDTNTNLNVKHKKKFDEGGVITYDDGYQFKEVSEQYARENWQNEDIFAINLDDQTERVIESEDDIDDYELFGVEMEQKFSGGGKITVSDIKDGSAFKSKNGDVFIIDKVEEYDPKIKWTPVNTSLEGGKKFMYRDDIKDLVNFLNELKCTKAYAGGGKVESIKDIDTKEYERQVWGKGKTQLQVFSDKNENVRYVFDAKGVFLKEFSLDGGETTYEYAKNGYREKAPTYFTLGKLVDLRDKGVKTISLNGFNESINYVIDLNLDDTELKMINETSFQTTYKQGGKTKEPTIGSFKYRVYWLEDGVIKTEYFKSDELSIANELYDDLAQSLFYYQKPKIVIDQVSDGKIIRGNEFEYKTGGKAPEMSKEIKKPRWWDKQVRPYEFFVFNTETNKVWAGNEYQEDAKDELKEFLLDAPSLPLKVLTKRAITNKKINPLAYENWARSSEMFETIKATFKGGGMVVHSTDFDTKIVGIESKEWEANLDDKFVKRPTGTDQSQNQEYILRVFKSGYGHQYNWFDKYGNQYEFEELTDIEKTNANTGDEYLTEMGYKYPRSVYFNVDGNYLQATQAQKDKKTVGIYYYTEDVEYPITKKGLDEISKSFGSDFEITLYTNAGVDLHSSDKGKYKNITVKRIKQKYANGGMSSMALAGASPQLAIANEVSNKLPATTSAIDKRMAERIYSDKPKWYEDRGMKYANGGMIGQDIVFDRWGEQKTGTITEVLSNGNFAVVSGIGSYLVEPKDVISFTAHKPEKKGWFFAQGGSTPYNYSWHFDHDRHNESEEYEVPKSKRKKFSGGGSVNEQYEWVGETNENGGTWQEVFRKGNNFYLKHWLPEPHYEYLTDISGIKNYKVFKSGEIVKFSGGGKAKEQRYIILSPDGFSISMDETYTESEILPAFNKWKKQFEKQGYYSTSNRERVALSDLQDMCSVIEVDEEETGE